jgi:hypothetical protein
LPDRNIRRLALAKWRMAVGAAALTSAVALAVAVLPTAAQATPTGLVTCRGGLSKATPTAQDPNLLGYQFHCSADIESYSIIVNRGLNDFGTIDDFNVAPNVYNDQLTEISPTETVDCQATTTPGNAINCFALGSTTPQVVTAYNWTEGQIDTTDPFCGGLPKGAKATATPEPAADAQLIVTDNTGAEWGPFPLPLTPGCKTPAKAKTKPAKKKHHKS